MDLSVDSDYTYKVLIVDDVPENIQLIGNILADHKVEISFALEGRQALNTVLYNPPDLILLDISMPEMNGFEVCLQLKENHITSDIPVIFLTALDQHEDIIHGLQIGAVDYVTKPYNSVELITRVFNHLKHKRARDIIARQNEKLKELNSMKDKFFSIIAHDLKNPLSLFLTTSQYITENVEKFTHEETKSFMEVINSSAQRLYSLINNLLQWSRSQSGRMDVLPQNVNLQNIVFSNIQLLQDVANQKRINIVSEVSTDINVYCDENMLQTVMRNLISNALKYSNNSSEVFIKANREEDHVLVSVEDTGVGIKKENINKLFRIDINYFTLGTANEQGTGLGLVLCKEFIERNNGEIWVESESGKGSQFKFRIPVKGKS